MAVLVAAALLAAGCATMPSSGPVVDARVPSVAINHQASDIDPVPPRPGASATEIAQGFLDAMTASPIRLDVARDYLSASAAAQWDPLATWTYSRKGAPRLDGDHVVVRLRDAHRLDASGAWRGALPSAAQRLDLRVVEQHGQLRLADPPDALIVPDTWFAQRFRQASLFFFDPGARILVPQPVFVPRGDQFATALLSDLVLGPGPGLRGVVRTFLPPGLSLNLSVTVSPLGVADVALVGTTAPLGPASLERLLVQLAFTLRQQPGITALTLSIGGVPVALPGGAATYDVSEADRYAPTGFPSSSQLYGVRQRRLVSTFDIDFTPDAGPLSTRPHDIRSATVDIYGDAVAAVTRGGHEVLMAPMGASSAEVARVRRVVTGGTDLLPPAWDFSGRVWLVDRRSGGARVSYVQDGRVHPLRVPGVSGQDVVRFLVSRDGTRLVAAVRGDSTDQVRVARIAVDERGRVVRVGAAVSVSGSDTDPVRVKDLAWTSPTTIAVLSPLISGQVLEVRTVRIDGSPSDADDLATTVPAPVLGLAAGPEPDETPYAVTPDGLLDLDDGTTEVVTGAPVRDVGYAG